MSFRIRLLPLTMIVAGALMSLKVAEVLHGGQDIMNAFGITAVKAQAEPEKKDAEKKDPEKKDEPKKDEKPAEPAAAEGEAKPAEGEGAEKKGGLDINAKEKAEKAKKESEAAKQKADSIVQHELHGGPSVEPPPVEEPGSGKGLAPGSRYFSPIELEILQTLTKRREQLDSWQKELELKENLLSNVEKRIDEKVVQVEDMKKSLQEMLVQYNAQEDAKIKSLVKIYENMKPKDAARIFDEVEMPILLLVIDRMSEKKVAPILASMDSKKAKQLTVELAEQRRLQGARLSNTNAPAAAYAPVAAPQPPVGR